MNINISINDKEKGGAIVTTSSHTPATDDAQNSGASKAGGSGGATASADVLDIGTPPAWLVDAIKKDATATAASEETPTSNTENQGGIAPSFN